MKNSEQDEALTGEEGYWEPELDLIEGYSDSYVISALTTCVLVEAVQEQLLGGLASINYTWTCKAVPPGYIAVENNLYHWTGSTWNLCRSSGFYYNTATTRAKSPIASNWSLPVCDKGYYENITYGEMWNGSSWTGGSLASGEVYWSGHATSPLLAPTAPVGVTPAPTSQPQAPILTPPPPGTVPAATTVPSTVPAPATTTTAPSA